MLLKLSDFDYTLPRELIAQYPLKQRDDARLMVLRRKDGSIVHASFRDITDYLRKGDLLVLNDTKVLPSRIFGFRLSGGKVEVLLLAKKHGLTFRALIKPARLRLKEKILFDNGTIYGQITSRDEITFFAKSTQQIYKLGQLPLPHYIKRRPEGLDRVYYQTIYARKKGSIASPTAGLHFTQESFVKIKSKGVNTTCITLHIGYSTFKPVKVEDITLHKIEPEFFNITEEAAQAVAHTCVNHHRVIAAGTTTLRALETYVSGKAHGHTDLFIYPGYDFRICDCLLTNFHLPRTTLFILVCAFAGKELINKAYQEAVDKKYRFYSYGDAMLII